MQRIEHLANLPLSTVAPNDVANLPDIRDLRGDGVVWLQILGTFVASYTLEMSTDGKAWVEASAQFYDVGAKAFLAADSTAPKLLKFAGAPPLLRARCTAFTSAPAPTDPPRIAILGEA